MGRINKKDLGVTRFADTSDGTMVYGCGDTWVLICKAWNAEEDWMKSTKALEVPNGCFLQVTTQQGDNVAESVCFAPGVTLLNLLNEVE